MSDDLKNLKEIARFADSMAGSVLGGLGCLTTVFFLVLPIATVVVFLVGVLCDADSTCALCNAVTRHNG